MKNIREFKIAAAGSFFGMIAVVILLKQNGDSVPELIPKAIILFGVVTLAIRVCARCIVNFIIAEKKNNIPTNNPFDHRQKLFSYLHNECEFIPVESNMIDIEDICNADLKEENKNLRECLNYIAEATNEGKSIFQHSINSMATKHLQ